MAEFRGPFVKLLEFNAFSINSANHGQIIDKLSSEPSWERTQRLGYENYQSLLSDRIIMRKGRTLLDPFFSRGKLDAPRLIMSSDSDQNPTSVTEVAFDTFPFMTEHSDIVAPRGKGRCGCGNCREANTKVSQDLISDKLTGSVVSENRNHHVNVVSKITWSADRSSRRINIVDRWFERKEVQIKQKFMQVSSSRPSSLSSSQLRMHQCKISRRKQLPY